MNNQQTNIVTLLQKILDQSQSGPPGCVNITPDDRAFIQQYLYGHNIELHARVQYVAEITDGPQPVKEHFFVKGARGDIFAMLTSMARQSPNLADILVAAGSYIRATITKCPICHMPHRSAAPCGNIHEWNFSNQTQENGTTNSNPPTPEGGL